MNAARLLKRGHGLPWNSGKRSQGGAYPIVPPNLRSRRRLRPGGFIAIVPGRATARR